MERIIESVNLIRLSVKPEFEMHTVDGIYLEVDPKILKCVKCDYVFIQNYRNYPLCKSCFYKWEKSNKSDFWKNTANTNLLNGNCHILSDSEDDE